MLNILTREVINQVIRVLIPNFQTLPNYQGSQETLLLINEQTNFLRFIIDRGSGPEEIPFKTPPGFWYPSDLIQFFEKVASKISALDDLKVTFNFETKVFTFSVDTGIFTFSTGDPGLATLLNLVIPATPGTSFSSSTGVEFYSGPDQFANLKWTDQLLHGNVPLGPEKPSNLFIGAIDQWNRETYPAILIDVEGATSKDYNIGRQDVELIRDDAGKTIATRYAGAWQDTSLSVTIVAKGRTTRDLLMDYVALLLVFFVRVELERVGITMMAPLSIGGKASAQDADDPGEIVYTGTLTGSYFCEWQVDIPIRGGQATLLHHLLYLEATPSSLAQAVSSVRVKLISIPPGSDIESGAQRV